MRFMMIVKASKDSEAGKMPSEELLSAMGKYNEELMKAGVLVDLSGLQASSKGARIKFSGEKRTVIDGPFAETKELIAGYWIINVKSRAEAIEWAKRVPESRRRRQGRRDRDSPVFRDGGFRSERSDRSRGGTGERTRENEETIAMRLSILISAVRLTGDEPKRLDHKSRNLKGDCDATECVSIVSRQL